MKLEDMVSIAIALVSLLLSAISLAVWSLFLLTQR